MGRFLNCYRWWLLALVPVVGCVLLFLPVFLMGDEPKTPITMANAKKIREGMTQEEVAAIIGPPGDYTTGPCVVNLHGTSVPGTRFENWTSDEAHIFIGFDKRGRVAGWNFWPVGRYTPSFCDRARHLLGL
ncbi:MAG TPA: hypothetical protein VG013_28755 [Gemmataceae bacterium]|nr:hypothetical protein [Gemmataceae bacterium]